MRFAFVLIALILLMLSATSVSANEPNGPYAGDAISSGHSGQNHAGSAILKDEVIIAQENGNRVEWRHIILKGNDTEIGMALGQIAQKDYGIRSLSRYADPIYGKARQAYMEKNYPAMRERMRGIAMAYGLSPDDATFDTNTLPYSAGSFACSMVYFPPDTMDINHAIVCRNMEWYLVPLDILLGRTWNNTGKAAFTQNFILEIYPDSGYSTMAIGTSDLCAVFDGLNSKGLGISLLADSWMDLIPQTTISGGRDSGIASMQITRLVLETCKTVEEAKMAFLTNKEYLPMIGVHYMVYDSLGNSAIVEWNKTDGNLYFTDGSTNEPHIMTNHPLHIYSNYSTNDLPRETYLYDDPYDTFNRYIVLNNTISSHEGKFTEIDASNALGKVMANTVTAAEGAVIPVPINTIYNVIMDLTNRSMKVKFYIKDGPLDADTLENTSIFSPYIAFQMNDSTMQ